MTVEPFKRKLAAILSADVKGYSRLMGEDEAWTIRTLNAYKEAMGWLIQRYRGRVVDAPGDNLLAEFGSVVDAVNCAVEIQRELAERNAESPASRRMEFRIGVNLGDVVEEGEKLYGDGVNIAARLESLAEAGGICISGTAYDQVENKLGLEYEFLGEQTVKNIAKPVRAYRVLSVPGAAAHRVVKAKRAVARRWRRTALAVGALVLVCAAALGIWRLYLRPAAISVEKADLKKMAYPLPDKPSIAVLPFVNMSEDPKQEFFSDGVTEEIITALSKLPQIFVIARNSSFTYKGKPVKVQQVAEELGVQYVLEGSVRKQETRIRITAQFIDALTGRHIFSERYDRDLKEIFAIQDEVAIKVLTALRIALKDEQWARFQARGVTNLDAYFKLLEAGELTQKVNKEDNAQARRLAEEALALEPRSSRAYHVLAQTHFWDYWLGPPKSPEESTAQGIEMARRAIELDERSPYPHGLLGMLYINKGDYDRAVASGERAASMEPNSAIVLTSYGSTLYHASRPAEAIPVFQKALRLSPLNPPSMALSNIAGSHRMLGQYEEALGYYKRLLRDHPRHFGGNLALIATYALMGRQEDAQALVEQYLKINPKFSLERFARTIRQKDPAEVERFLGALRKAGLPDKPPLPLPDKPSIAVLPFANMSDDPKQEFFADGMAEEIINAFSKLPQVFVIARNSSFTYKGKSVDVRKVGRELGVNYVLEGSVRRDRDRVRVTAQLVDATSGSHAFSERFDREMKDIFALQDEITMKILTALQVKLTVGEQARIWAKGTKNLDAYLKCLEARDKSYLFNKESNILARELAKEATDLDPQYALAYSILGSSHMMDVWLGASESPQRSMAQAMELARKAIAMDESLGEPHGLLGFLYTMTGEHDKAIEEARKAVALDPNSDKAHQYLGLTLRFGGKPQEAIPAIKKAIRLNPFTPSNYIFNLGLALLFSGQQEEAIAECKKAIAQEPRNLGAQLALLAAYGLAGREEEARAGAAEVLRIDPNFSVERFSKTLVYSNQADRDRFIDALRKAGLPD